MVSGGSRPSDKGRGGGGGRRHPDPEIGGERSSKNFFSTLRASVWSKNKEAPAPPGPPGPSPGSATTGKESYN